MKAVFKKMIAVAFCAATAASMLSIGVSAADPLNQNLIEYGMYSDSSKSIVIEDNKGYSYGSVYVSMKVENWYNGTVTVQANYPAGVTGKTTYKWSGNAVTDTNADGIGRLNVNNDYYTATCVVTVSSTFKDRFGKEITVKEDVKLSVSGFAYPTPEAARAAKDQYKFDSNTGGYYNDKWYNQSDWDKNHWYWDGDGYWYWSNGWHYTTSRYPTTSSRPSYSREYEVDWGSDTFYYNGKVQLPTATVTIGGRTIELDVKLISGDGKSVGTHRVRASLPRGYYNYDLTGTTLRYTIEEAQKEGFVTEGGKTYYYENGKKVTGWKTIRGTDYYFLKDGSAAEGWEKIGPDTYYFSDGKMVTGWINDGPTTYYCYGTGKMCHGRWHEIDGYWYYFEKSGAMATSKWIQDGKKWYYVAGDGRMATNTTVPGGYKVGKDGAWIQ